MHRTIAPAIHYWGTPVILVSTLNADGTVNVAPMSSAWWLGWSCMLGFDASSQTVTNLKRERECVLNLASESNVDAVNRLTRTTGSRRVPFHKAAMGWRHEADKLARAGLTAVASHVVRAPRIAECPVQLEAKVVSVRPFARGDGRMAVPACATEVHIQETHVEESLLRGEDRIDPDRWRPLIMSFRELFSLAANARETPSRLARGPESAWAPWKRGLGTRLASRAYGVLAARRYTVDDETRDQEELASEES
jgi:flavin reductase (DIM6/NTAB) family NADH-FMN oxidoreductase RutF